MTTHTIKHDAIFIEAEQFSTKVYCPAIGSLSSHTPNWFLSPLALQETGTLHTTWRYSHRIAE